MFDFPEAFLNYLDANWDLLAASAYQGYLLQGRGVLWVDWLNQLPITSRLSDVGVIYLTPHSRLAREIFAEGMSKELRRLIGKYSPELAIVIYWSDGEINRGREVAVGGAATPSEAYERMKGQLIEFQMSHATRE